MKHLGMNASMAAAILAACSILTPGREAPALGIGQAPRTGPVGRRGRGQSVAANRRAAAKTRNRARNRAVCKRVKA